MRRGAYVLALLLVATTAAAQGEPEAEPLRCWWRASTGAITIGQAFDVRLTCAVLETDSVQVVPDEARLTVAEIQIPPFEIVGGDHPADTREGQRRFFQYRYVLRLVDADQIGQDVLLPRLPITYKVQSQVAANQTLVGRDFTYLMPPLSLRVVSMVPEDAADIRDGSDVGLERVETLRFRARLADIGAYALFAAAALMAVLAAVALVRRARPAQAGARTRVSRRRALGAIDQELSRIARESAGGWTPELVHASHAALRLVGAMALGREISEKPVAPGEAPAEGRVAVRAMLPWRQGVAIASAMTTADLVRGLRELPLDAPFAQRSGLEALRDALAAVTVARYATGGASPDADTLARAVEAGRTETAWLAREERGRWLRRLMSPRAWWSGATRS